jgi:hypothetical protein
VREIAVVSSGYHEHPDEVGADRQRQALPRPTVVQDPAERCQMNRPEEYSRGPNVFQPGFVGGSAPWDVASTISKLRSQAQRGNIRDMCRRHPSNDLTAELIGASSTWANRPQRRPPSDVCAADVTGRGQRVRHCPAAANRPSIMSNFASLPLTIRSSVRSSLRAAGFTCQRR